MKQLSNETSTVESAELAEEITVGDVSVVVVSVDERGEVLTVGVEIGGIDDTDGIDSFRLVTGDRRLEPVAAPADGRCTSITTAVQTCSIEFDLSAADGSSRVLVLRRGDEQRNWVLSAP